MAENDTLRIGAFSTLSRLSVRMLRYYDTHGVLSPASTDPDTGYRQYAAGQLAEALLIRQLRDIGFSVSAIAALLPLRHDQDALRRAFAVQRDQLTADAAQTQRRIADLDHLVNQLEESAMTTITTAVLPAQRVAAWRMQIANYWSEGVAWEKLMTEAGQQGLPFLPDPCGATFFDDGYQEAEVDIEVWLPIPADAQVAEPLTDKVLPAQRVLMATVQGPYDLIGPASDALAAQIAEQGLQPSGPMFNRYLVGPGRTEDPNEYVTEVCIPIS